jgi:F420-non-reducing hydrogenase iron-sulfur subunit
MIEEQPMMQRNATIHLFYCSNSMTDSELASLQSQVDADGLQMLGLPCSGKMTIPYLLKAFEKGADGVVICACPETECKHLEGNLRASKRAEAVDALIDEIGLGKGRVVLVTKKEGQIDTVIETVQKLQKELRVVCSPGNAKVSRPAAGARPTVVANNRRENAA